MIKHFCDCCKKELTQENSVPVQIAATALKTPDPVTLQVMHNHGNTVADVCRVCLGSYLDNSPRMHDYRQEFDQSCLLLQSVQNLLPELMYLVRAMPDSKFTGHSRESLIRDLEHFNTTLKSLTLKYGTTN